MTRKWTRAERKRRIRDQEEKAADRAADSFERVLHGLGLSDKDGRRLVDHVRREVLSALRHGRYRERLRAKNARDRGEIDTIATAVASLAAQVAALEARR